MTRPTLTVICSNCLSFVDARRARWSAAGWWCWRCLGMDNGDSVRITCPHCRGGLLLPIRYCNVCAGYGVILVSREEYERMREEGDAAHIGAVETRR